MPYSRRSVLRDAALMSIAGITGTSPILMGCNEHKRFADGIRVFFAGAWLFCADPYNPNLMRAVSVNPAEMCPPVTDMNHIFPFGVWIEEQSWDKKQPSLPANAPSSGGANLMPYSVSIVGTRKPACNVDQLFGSASASSQFTYIVNTGRVHSIDWTQCGMRVISVPLPTRIIPAAFRTSTKVCDPSGRLHPCGNSNDRGVATTHIFEYEGASSLTFIPPYATGAQTMPHGTDYKSDYHFHTVPDKAPTEGHDKIMFGHLMNLLKGNTCADLKLKPGPLCPPETVARGAAVPSSISSPELEMALATRKECGLLIDLASCGSSGVGLGDGGQ